MKLTILMYHKVADPPPGARHLGNYVTPRQFEEQLDALLEWGYRTITLDQWLAYREGGIGLSAKPLIITFDDGYRCFATTAWPALRARAMAAAMFIVTSQIGGTNAWDADEVQEPLLTALEILELERDGVVFGSHSHTHVPLGKVSPDVALDELTRSRTVLEQLLAKPVTALSYPYSNQNRSVRALAQRAGYRLCVRGKGRMNHRSTDIHGLRRIKFDYRASIDDVRRVLFKARWMQW
jgi:peptidoglycan/xylan/chitin deacetylase (PgdA/CDA1 family)